MQMKQQKQLDELNTKLSQLLALQETKANSTSAKPPSDKANVQIKSKSKVSADEFDKFDGANDTKKVSADSVDHPEHGPKESTLVESDMLSKGKVIADSFDSQDSNTTSKAQKSKSTKTSEKPKSEKKEEKPTTAAQKPEKPEEHPHDQTQALADSLMAEQNVTTEELEAQAQ
mmetsp:Transcript_29500/g.44833  ORF Transcript_29500/g.44833 Transcript_29500/m.44833 type:complete len:173 (+) Transcript_29500:1933-2451(+)